MAVTVVVGGQYGSEGKGKLVAHLVGTTLGEVAVVRCGGTNSGHTIDVDGRRHVLRQLPSGVGQEACKLYLGAGMVVDPALLKQEMHELQLARDRVIVDRNAVILEPDDLRLEESATLLERVGSTLSGTGWATARKVLRDPGVKLAGSEPALTDIVGDVSTCLNELIDRGGTVIVEGTQGAGLSLHHARHYPYVTGRDTSASAFLSEVGLSPRLVTEVIVVLRTYPIRVAGHSGPLPGEITWETITRRCGAPCPLTEMTSVTKRVRRVAEFDWDQALEAVRLNRPSSVALHGLDYLDFADRQATQWDELSLEAKGFVDRVEERLNTPVQWAFNGPDVADVLDIRGRATSGSSHNGSSHKRKVVV